MPFHPTRRRVLGALAARAVEEMLERVRGAQSSGG